MTPGCVERSWMSAAGRAAAGRAAAGCVDDTGCSSGCRAAGELKCGPAGQLERPQGVRRCYGVEIRPCVALVRGDRMVLKAERY